MSGANGQPRADQEITIEELLQRIDAACGGLSAHHPGRLLLQQCRVAIVYLAERIPDERLKYSRIVRP